MESQSACHEALNVVADPCVKGVEVLERNISNEPISENQLRKLFNAFTPDGSGSIPIDTVIEFYKSLDHIGVPRLDREIRWAVSECAKSKPDALTFPEFACFMLKITQW